MKQVMGAKEDAPGTFSRGGERLSACTALCSCRRLLQSPVQGTGPGRGYSTSILMFSVCV